MQKESERFHTWTQHIYQHFSEELVDPRPGNKAQDRLVRKEELSAVKAQDIVGPVKTGDTALLRRRLDTIAKTKPS